MTPQEENHLIQTGVTCFRSGDQALAESIFQQLIAVRPDHPVANEYLAYIAGNAGRTDLAQELLARACRHPKCSTEALYYLGSACLRQGQPAEAIDSFKRAIKKGGEFFEALHDLATAQAQVGERAAALVNFGKAARLRPDSPDVAFNLGRLHDDLGQFDRALKFYDQVLRLAPAAVEAWSNKGVVLHQLQRHAEALAHQDRAIALAPAHAQAWANKAITLQALRRFDEALACIDEAIRLAPEQAENWSNKGLILHGSGRTADALRHYERATQLRGDYAEAWTNMGLACHDLGRHDEALQHYSQAQRLQPDMEFLYGHVQHTRMKLCDWSDFAQHVKALTAQINQRKRVAPPFPMLALVDAPAIQRRVAETWMQAKCPPLPELPAFALRPASDKIRLGYFSADFHDHATSYLIAEFFERHDKTRFELIAFSFGPDRDDASRRRLVAAFDQFIDVREQSDMAVAAQARSLGVDIAIDLKGYTQDCRTGIFAARAAPLQVNYLGYPGTMAAPYIDYIIADAVVIPTEARAHFSEKIVTLPDCYQVNDTQRRIAERVFTRAEVGLPDTGFVFCCFNNNTKITPSTFDVWMRIVQQVEGSVLWLFEEHATATANLRKAAAQRGVSPDRLVFAQRLNLPEHLARHRLADLFLDTLPYNAHTTASDALWAGLPVLTQIGQAFPGRVAASLLTALELPELVTRSALDYEQRAIALARDAAQLEALRARLATQRLHGRLFDAARFTRHMESAYIEMMRRRRAGQRPEHITIVA